MVQNEMATLDAGFGIGENFSPWKNIKNIYPEIQTTTKSSQGDDTRCFVYLKKISLFVCLGISFVVILGTSVLSKMTLSLMAAQTLPNRTMKPCVKEPNNHYLVETPPTERMAWNWSLWFVLVIPEIFVILKSAWVCAFKNVRMPSLKTFFIVLVGETLHTIGMCILVFEVIPKLDSLRGLMFLNGLCFIPGCLTMMSRNPSARGFRFKLGVDMVCLVGLLGGLILWAQGNRQWVLPVAGVLVSCNWWENFAKPGSAISFVRTLAKCKKELQKENSKSFVYLIVSFWKIIVAFVAFVVFLLIHSTENEDLMEYMWRFTENFQDQPVTLMQTYRASAQSFTGPGSQTFSSAGILPFHLLLIQVSSSLACYLFSYFACRIGVQELAFSLTLLISNPVAVLLSSSACSWRMEDSCLMTNVFPEYVYWNCPRDDFFQIFMGLNYGYVWIIWFVSQVWFMAHVWKPTTNSEELFFLPFYDGAIVEQSLVTNRLREGTRRKKTAAERAISYATQIRRNTIIYGCATIWHEEPDEMVDIMKSIMRMDKELGKGTLGQRIMIDDLKYDFQFESHIFFDDAFMMVHNAANNLNERVVNKYVKCLVRAKFEAERSFYRNLNVIIERPPDIFVTPYGGKIIWTLPGNSKVHVHLKDKQKIRVKKRWSQVMYMFYLLGHIMLDQVNEVEDVEENTFILALDGDVDFQPQAVKLLLDLMRRNPLLGAACGRIHPIGVGPIAWYQRFEYAIGHWLQKATEHVAGCVLCSPGCFSLFRAKALLQVMQTYSKTPEKPIDHVQFDLGEDRWLCTLLLKSGYSIEYSAASDAYTRCPDSFKVFYNQRRRWGPSTMANILDILKNWKATVKNNQNISTIYMIYQSLIMAGTVLGPGTIFLMVTGAVSAAFKISNAAALLGNLTPITIFILVCFFTKEDTQILIAMILSTLYALLMMAVLVGTSIQLKDDGISSPSGIFLIALASSFVVAAIIHPQEFYCLKHGIIYFLLVPSMYLLLTLYSLINMNMIVWGTREEKKTDDKSGDILKKKGGYFSRFSDYFHTQSGKSGVSRLCSCLICTHEKEDESTQHLLENVSVLVEETNRKISTMEKSNATHRLYLKKSQGGITELETLKEEDIIDGDLQPQQDEGQQGKTVPEERQEIDNARWTKSKIFNNCEVKPLDPEEETFWEEVIEAYLKKPKDPTPREKDILTNDLKDMRNSYVFAFFMLNGLFILIIFLLQINKDELYITWPVNANNVITYNPSSSSVQIDWVYLHLEPFGFVFALFFGVILVVQFLAMIAHRFGTFSHLMEDETLNCKVKRAEKLDFDPDNMVFETDSEEEVEPSDLRLHRKSIAPVINRDPSKRKMSIYLTQKQEMDEPAKNLEEALKRRAAEEVREMVRLSENPKWKKKLTLHQDTIRRMSMDTRVQEAWIKEKILRRQDIEALNGGLSRTPSSASELSQRFLRPKRFSSRTRPSKQLPPPLTTNVEPSFPASGQDVITIRNEADETDTHA